MRRSSGAAAFPTARGSLTGQSWRCLLAARLDQLDPAERSVLERGAVEGKVFHRSVVEALAPEESQVRTRLLALVRRELVRPDRPILVGDDAYRFRHLLIRDATYESLPKSTRAELHERFAWWLAEHGLDLSSSTRSSATTSNRRAATGRAAGRRRAESTHAAGRKRRDQPAPRRGERDR